MKENAVTSLLKRSWAALDDPSRVALRRLVRYQLVIGGVSFLASVFVLPLFDPPEQADLQPLIVLLVIALIWAIIGLVLQVRAYRPIRDWFLMRQAQERPEADIGWRGADALVLFLGLG